MKDGIYVTAYLYFNEIGYYYKWSSRHDPNITIWKKVNNDIYILKTVEVERLSGLKHHTVAFKNVETVYKIIEEELRKLNINIKDVVEIWGTPILDNGVSINYSIDEFSDYTYHGICHLYSAILMDSEKFYNDEILGFAMDYGPDAVIDHYTRQYNYIGCYVKNGNIDYFPICSHGPFWSYAAHYFWTNILRSIKIYMSIMMKVV